MITESQSAFPDHIDGSRAARRTSSLEEGRTLVRYRHRLSVSCHGAQSTDEGRSRRTRQNTRVRKAQWSRVMASSDRGGTKLQVEAGARLCRGREKVKKEFQRTVNPKRVLEMKKSGDIGKTSRGRGPTPRTSVRKSRNERQAIL